MIDRDELEIQDFAWAVYNTETKTTYDRNSQIVLGFNIFFEKSKAENILKIAVNKHPLSANYIRLVEIYFHDIDIINKQKIIGFAGMLGTGKDTACDFLIENRKAHEKISFAESVKDCAQDYFGIPIDGVKDYRKRKYYQAIGQGMRDIQDSVDSKTDVWINIALDKVINPNKVYVISDVRYVNEVKRIIDEGGLVIFLTTDLKVIEERIRKRDGEISGENIEEIVLHSSEKDVYPQTFFEKLPKEYHKHVITVENNGNDEQEFNLRIAKAVEEYLK